MGRHLAGVQRRGAAVAGGEAVLDLRVGRFVRGPGDRGGCRAGRGGGHAGEDRRGGGGFFGDGGGRGRGGGFGGGGGAGRGGGWGRRPGGWGARRRVAYLWSVLSPAGLPWGV